MEKATQILLVEDDPNFGAVLRDYLELHDFDVVLAKDGVQGLQAFKGLEPDLCILDVMMPHKDGFTLGGEIKEIAPQMPLIFLTAKSLKEDMLKGYQVGADDYIVKPFDSEVLLYKIKAVLSRKSGGEAEDENVEFEIGTYSYNSETRVLTHPEVQNTLSPKEGALLSLLLRNKNHVVSRSEALKKIWKDENYFTGRSMDVYVAKLRKHLKHDESVALVNVHSEGFRLVDQVSS
ncbi:response regulator transcription factor [Owenweeksia hongkongensis]|uniref:Response regulator with CheY-like receiver domain and winged-helix DNA-binding domain n=1 Tax=Owenweeksia hongkongensis (strain DSM 17368 / CIP 108786 / JCM 12287 / NRRL B-23963 / UST20020801) TaxID=926562 RepID=G8R6V4_OWEHD|nr:response regulator transcription factor [Owenweeksia hongkongensis]AEV32289.1 response regulator with CheY-like receiver domain and winged-helix DNA-binding domain [Owenweeksia hongkongensis DSM 17368]